MRRLAKSAAVAAVLALGSGAVAVAQDAGFVAGTEPSQRRGDVPVITVFTPPAGWREQALHGVEQPYPASLSWLDDQGAWFNPFLRPGMTGPYDIRGWHAAQ